VDEETILKDYMLTNTYNADRIDNERQILIEQGYEGEELNRYRKAMDEVDIQYMENALTWMKDNYGSVKGYITQELGVTEAQIEQLQARYLHNMTAHPAKEATCTEAGNKAYWTCDCGKYFSDVQGENEIGKDDVVIQAKGHTSVKDPAVAPTHTNTGLTEGSHCSVCGAVLEKQEVVKKLAKDPQPMTVKATKKKVKASKLKKKKQVISPITVKSALGTVSYKITGGNKKSKKALKINKNTGKVTVKKKTKKGTYKVKVKVTAAGNENYKVGSKTVSVKVVVK
jgi:hypothetical protein